MPDFVVNHTEQWIDHFAKHGYEVRPLAAGVEGAVYDLGAGLVAKVWRDRSEAELERMQGFYADVAAASLPFATPEIIRIDRVGGTAVSYERKLPGEPMQNRLSLDDETISQATVASVIDVLRALATVTATSAMRQLAVLDERQPLWAGATDFQGALLSLLARRVARFGEVLRQQLPDFDRRYHSLRAHLARVSNYPSTVVHGDLLGGNILVDGQGRPLAVLDFGFLTTAGDPRLDAAITASIMNMYGPHAPAITRSLTARFADDLGYSPRVLLIYQAAYAVATSNAFTPDGTDGHFAWCLTQLRRPDVSDALGL